MSQTISIDIGNGFYESDSLPFANQRCINLYPNYPQAPALKQSSLFGVQGLEQVASVSYLARDKNRGGWVFNGAPYFVNGDALYRLNRTVNLDSSVTYTTTRIGNVAGQGFCYFADNGTQLIIINQSGNGYIYQPTGSPQFQQISDPDFLANGTPQAVAFVDGYFVVTTDQKKAIVSAVNNGLSWNALDFFSAEADPDAIVAPFVLKNQLYLLGTETTETYQNIGGAGVPFRRINGFVLSQGCSARYSVQKVGDAVFWVGKGEKEQPAIYAFTGSTPQKISTTAIDNKLHDLSENEVADIFSWAYSVRGNSFIGFTAGTNTFVYDLNTGKWHERQSSVRDRNGNRIDQRCRIMCVLSAYNELYVGDSEDGRIGIINASLNTEYDEPLIAAFTTSPLYNMSSSFTLPKIELVCESGVGTTEVPDPVVMMAISRDGALFENPRTRELGASGARNIRQIWYKNGRVSRLAIFKFTISDAVRRRLYGLEVNIKGGTRNA